MILLAPTLITVPVAISVIVLILATYISVGLIFAHNKDESDAWFAIGGIVVALLVVIIIAFTLVANTKKEESLHSIRSTECRMEILPDLIKNGHYTTQDIQFILDQTCK